MRVGVTQSIDCAHTLPDTEVHGHTYRVTIWVDGEISKQTGMVYPLRQLRRQLAECLRQYDHKNLNDIIDVTHQIGQSVMLDNGAFTLWRRNPRIERWPWDAYYAWVLPWLDFPTTWCVIPDVIGGTEAENDRLLAEWFARQGSFRQAAPVWHLHESLSRLDRLVRGFERVCFGSSGEYSTIGNVRWNNRMNDVFNHICRGSGRPPCWIHMLRGMSLAGSDYPFASVDSSDIGRNHNREQNNPKEMAMRWDAVQCPGRWNPKPIQEALINYGYQQN